MANNPKRIQDPTEAAMSAIQEALNLREDPPAPRPPGRAGSADGARRRSVRQHDRPDAGDARTPGAAPPDPQRAPDRRRSVPAGHRSAAPSRAPRRRSKRSSRPSAPPMTTASRSARSCSRCSGAPRARPTWRRSSSRSSGWCSASWSALSYFGTDLRGDHEPGRASDAVRARGRHRAAGAAVLRAGAHDPPRAGIAHHRALDDRGRDAACRAGDDRARSRSCRSGRRSGARSPPWATAWNARSRAPPSSKRWCTTRSRRSSAPTTTTSCASAA